MRGLAHFPPQPTRTHEIAVAVEVLRSVLHTQATYVSAPVTSGKRAYELRKAGGDPEGIIRGNRTIAEDLVRRVRERFPGPVVDPTSVGTLAGWTQDDYRELWARVIERYAMRVVFADGWEYSHGCAYEFLTAYRFSIPTVDESGTELDLSRGLVMLQSAVRDLRKGRNERAARFLQKVVAELVTIAARSSVGAYQTVGSDA